MDELTPDAAITLGGWDARCAVTLAVASACDVAAALVDTNGDGADIDLDQYERDAAGHWNEIGSGSAGDAGSSWSPRLTAAWGRTDPLASVEIEYLGSRRRVIASAAGWWLFVAAATSNHRALPSVIAPLS